MTVTYIVIVVTAALVGFGLALLAGWLFSKWFKK